MEGGGKEGSGCGAGCCICCGGVLGSLVDNALLNIADSDKIS